ncbi:tetratricopeptide repeat protein [Mesorhizobium abyssinicae]|uniref:tetratricopeptide repeat protein n=1 Tax=Mesorhizobium abyssinicae TaxID=1209958 RepID=UPI003393AB69
MGDFVTRFENKEQDMPGTPNTPKLAVKVRGTRIAIALQEIEDAWEAEDYAGAAILSRQLLQSDPGAIQGLVHLARAAALIGDWDDVAEAGGALVRSSPKDAFVAAGKLNRAGRALEAAKIFAQLNVQEDWFDAEAANLARKDADLLIAAGEAAVTKEDSEAANVIWVAGVQIAPRSQILAGKVRRLTRGLKMALANLDPDKDPDDYADVCRDLAWVNPSNLAAAVRFARASERSGETTAVDAWLKVLSLAPDNEAAAARLGNLAGKGQLEDHAISGLLALGRGETFDPIIKVLAAGRDARARKALDKDIRLATQRAAKLKREANPKAYLAAWKDVLALEPDNLRAARKVIGGAGHLRDYAALVDGWAAYLEITPEAAGADRLAAAALRAGDEQRALECLARNRLTGELPKARLNALCKRVLQAGKVALRDSEFDFTLACYQTLTLVDHAGADGLRFALANALAASARRSEIEGDRAGAVAQAEQALELVPDHAAALTLVARHRGDKGPSHLSRALRDQDSHGSNAALELTES